MLLASSKGSEFRRVSLFTLPFFLPSAGKGNGFRRFPLISLPFRLLASSKSSGFRRVSLFTLPFCRRPCKPARSAAPQLPRPYKHANSVPQRSGPVSNMILHSAPLLRSFRRPYKHANSAPQRSVLMFVRVSRSVFFSCKHGKSLTLIP